MNYSTNIQTKNERIQALVSKAKEFPKAEVTVNDVYEAIINRTITAISDNTITEIRQYTFCNCVKLTSADFPICVSIGEDAFHACNNLSSINFPSCIDINNYAFYYCSKITTASFPACRSIDYDAFDRCFRLSSLTLGASSVCILKESNAFVSTPFANYKTYFSGTPHIYVPSSLVEAYKNATNWVYFSSYFSSIESLGNDLVQLTFNLGILGDFTCTAKKGMTWAEWVDSEYNTEGFVTQNNLVFYLDEGQVYGVVSSDIISDDGYYYIETGWA